MTQTVIYNEQKELRKHGDGDDASAVQRVVGYKEEENTQSCLTMLKKVHKDKYCLLLESVGSYLEHIE